MAPERASIATDRLDLVPLTVADADEMAGVLADPALYSFIGGEPPTRAHLVERYGSLVAGRSADGREEWHNWIVRRRSDGAATGFVQATIVDDGRGADIAWLIGTAWQGRGLAGEAAIGLVGWLESAGVTEITAHIHPAHAASGRVAARAGLEPTDAIVDDERVWRRHVAVRSERA
jgi:RimJ/RimL family protein N-acetyltransferase